MSQGRKMDREIGKTSLLAIKNDTLPPTENSVCRQYIALGRHTSLALHSFCWVFLVYSENIMWCLYRSARDFSCGSNDFGLTRKPLVTSEAALFFLELRESSDKQLKKWNCSCNKSSPCVQFISPLCLKPRLWDNLGGFRKTVSREGAMGASSWSTGLFGLQMWI